MTTFHIIHILVGIWLVLTPLLGIFEGADLVWNSVIIGAVVGLYNAYYLFIRSNVDVNQEKEE